MECHWDWESTNNGTGIGIWENNRLGSGIWEKFGWEMGFKPLLRTLLVGFPPSVPIQYRVIPLRIVEFSVTCLGQDLREENL